MGTTPLRRFLQSLCNNSCWSYAVFWKLQQQSQMFLMWEDGYFGTSKVENSMDNMFAVENSFGSLKETSSYNGTLSGDAVELAVAYMSTFYYALGDGVVGDVAYKGNCRWVFADSKSWGEFNTAEHADEWLFQFAAGIKTILLVPVIPHGVLQLGSLEDIPEDEQMAKYIKDEFVLHQDFNGYSDAFATNQKFSSLSPSLVMSTMMKSLDDFSSIVMNEKRSDDSTINDNINWSNHVPLTKDHVTPTSESWHSSNIAGTDMHTMVAKALPETLTWPASTNVIDYEMPMKEQPLVSDVSPFLSFPKECELHKALGPAFMGKSDDSFQHLSIGDSSSSKKPNGMLFCKANVQNLKEKNSTIQTSGESSLSSSFSQFASLARRKNINDEIGFEGESSLFSSHVIAPSVFTTRVKNPNNSSSPSGISYEGVADKLREKEEQKIKYDVSHQSEGLKSSVASKRRGKSGAKQKARPRDRQLIQDRLKDLRELVPNGAKCSIDGLLDRTVKHMLFLESVSDRAMKLRQCVHQPEKVGTGPKNSRTPEDKFSQNGASWAFELGGDSEVCPIYVEDLHYPGHMIIEMICDESLRFLEIAEVIHGLNLTILNGMMEKRSSNTWARYIIEAPKGFHRLDIFWPLMKLLQQKPSPISSKI